jgi:hypothetical protein
MSALGPLADLRSRMLEHSSGTSMSMSATCCNHPLDDPHRGNEGYRRVLWAVLAINAAMFAVEVAAVNDPAWRRSFAGFTIS